MEIEKYRHEHGHIMGTVHHGSGGRGGLDSDIHVGCVEVKDWDLLDVIACIFMFEVVVGLGFLLMNLLMGAMK